MVFRNWKSWFKNPVRNQSLVTPSTAARTKRAKIEGDFYEYANFNENAKINLIKSSNPSVNENSDFFPKKKIWDSIPVAPPAVAPPAVAPDDDRITPQFKLYRNNGGRRTGRLGVIKRKKNTLTRQSRKRSTRRRSKQRH